MPDFAHLPLIHGPDGKKLSRLGADFILEETSATQGVAIFGMSLPSLRTKDIYCKSKKNLFSDVGESAVTNSFLTCEI